MLSRLNKTLSPKYQRLKAIWDKPYLLNWRLRPLFIYVGRLPTAYRSQAVPSIMMIVESCSLRLLWLSVGYVSGSSTFNGTIRSHLTLKCQSKPSPVVTSTWKATREDPQLVRFGFMWKLYDEVAKRSLNYSPPALVRVGVLSSFDLRCLCDFVCFWA